MDKKKSADQGAEKLDNLFNSAEDKDAAEDKDTAAEANKPGRCVLVVDDAAATRYSICNMIHQLGHHTVEAVDGEEALQLAQTHRPDLIVLDILMPEKDGLETLRELRQNPDFAQTPVIMLTTASDHKTVRQALQEQISDYVLKPAKGKAFKARLKKYLD